MPRCLDVTPYGACGRCENCARKYRSEWVLRMMFEAALYPPGQCSFLTLTYDEDSLPYTRVEAIEQWQLFAKRLRHHHQFRFVASLERGDLNGRFHWHAILYGVPSTQDVAYNIERDWGHGFIKLLPATEKRMHYVMKYILKTRKLRQECKQAGAILMSRRPGIGAGAVKRLREMAMKMSDSERRKYIGTISIAQGKWMRKMGSLRLGKFYYRLHRYLRDRVKVEIDKPDMTPEKFHYQSYLFWEAMHGTKEK